ncbi:MAG: hypothetical protein K6C94_04630 [Candidatus Gastranaerophilales bacterium]|nr:hypothetical protein [Candidatus Gastranaerophilales bacterium]
MNFVCNAVYQRSDFDYDEAIPETERDCFARNNNRQKDLRLFWVNLCI